MIRTSDYAARVIEWHLPVECYARKSEDYQPRLLSQLGILQHYISAININQEDPFDLELVYNIFVEYRVSAHYLNDRDGTLYELVPPEYQAWHAGESEFMGMPYCNQYMFGIENIGMPNVDFMNDQYRSSAWLSAHFAREFDMDKDWIVGHEDVAPDRKTDPHGNRYPDRPKHNDPTWQWDYFFALYDAYLNN